MRTTIIAGIVPDLTSCLMVGLLVVEVERNSFFRSAVALTSLSFARASFGWLAPMPPLPNSSPKQESRGGVGWFGGVGLGVQATALLVKREKRSVM